MFIYIYIYVQYIYIIYQIYIYILKFKYIYIMHIFYLYLTYYIYIYVYKYIYIYIHTTHTSSNNRLGCWENPPSPATGGGEPSGWGGGVGVPAHIYICQIYACSDPGGWTDVELTKKFTNFRYHPTGKLDDSPLDVGILRETSRFSRISRISQEVGCEVGFLSKDQLKTVWWTEPPTDLSLQDKKPILFVMNSRAAACPNSAQLSEVRLRHQQGPDGTRDVKGILPSGYD